MNAVSVLGLVVIAALMIRQLRRDPSEYTPGKRWIYDSIYVVYCGFIILVSASGLMEEIEFPQTYIYGSGVALGCGLLVALAFVRFRETRSSPHPT